MPELADQLVTQIALARAMGLDRSTIRDLTLKGILPRERRSSLYRVGACFQAYLEYRTGQRPEADPEGLDYDTERARLTRAQAERAELRLARERGTVVEAASAQLALEHVLVPVRQYYLEQGDRLAPTLHGLTIPAIKAVIDRENEKELQRLANPVLEFTGQTSDPELDVLAGDPDSPEPATEEGAAPGPEVPGAAEE